MAGLLYVATMSFAPAASPAPISGYAMLSDCHAPALVSPRGSIDWWCPPRADGPSVFGKLLGPEAGHWSLQAEDATASVTRRYLPDSLVLETTITTADGEVVVTDALSLDPDARGHDIGTTSPQLLVRSVGGRRGRVRMHTTFRPRIEYGLTTPVLERTAHGVTARGGALVLRLQSPVPLDCDGGQASATWDLTAGARATFALDLMPAYGAGADGGTALDPDEALAGTLAAWRSWVAVHEPFDGTYGDVLRRSALVLQGLTYQPSGAVLAATTTSLPAAIGGTDNWDYRYTWLRDLSLTAQALWIVACPDEAGRFLRFIVDSSGEPAEGGRVQIMYGIDGRRRLPETELAHLPGHAGSIPVRVGNAAWSQSQLDVMGEVLDMALRYRQQLEPVDDATRRLLLWLAEQAASTWEDPDAGMWEARDQRRQYTTSKVMCWVALDRAVKLADLLDASDRVQRWQAEADRIRETVLREAWHEEARAFTGAFGSDHLDASVLLLPLVGFIPADDDRMLATLEAVQERLCRGGMVYRWDGDANGFVLCTAWLVECLAMAGRRAEAVDLFERLLGRAGDLGLYAEQIDPQTGAHTGNFPQAFSHVGIVNAAWRLQEGASPTTS